MRQIFPINDDTPEITPKTEEIIFNGKLPSFVPPLPEATVTELPIEKLRPYPNHPFKMYDGERLKEMLASIREYGILVPVVVRELLSDAGFYEILSGHNRVNAAKEAEIETVPARILENVSDELAALIVTESNFRQRDSASFLTPSGRTASKCTLKR
ncbi:hypothetical protein FACS18949_15160 [Clostridia bacterium]|nr:hypothetical protein FACS18949_15160 [Clostridia bacterium]